MKRISSSRGAITLLMTTALLAVTLMLSLGMMKTVFYQLKRAQNELKQRQLHWRAEGGIECAVALVAQYEADIEAQYAATHTLEFELCSNELQLEEVGIEQSSANTYLVYAEENHFRINRFFTYQVDLTAPANDPQFVWRRGGWGSE
ncbi:hypothetical protein FCU94_03865 [Vibrio sp. JPW-9-11-11]|uniref:hypothetical protein n=1 Tax=Vibrio sp. JPW-9-11-11 TaxID=1416532 RepID=UPI0015946D56|nr:hypothetical protein [Vibrio sp. JPW-9-11-11]NVD06043.1 hypothetical protein [Vibrio sp. JPW-9-11-11]